MQMQLITTAIAATLLSVAFTASAEQLMGPQIKELMSGAKLTGRTSRGNAYEGIYKADGTMSGSVSGGKHTDTGKWTVEDDTYCSQWSQWGKGAKRCSTIYKVEANKYRFIRSGGTGAQTFTVERL